MCEALLGSPVSSWHAVRAGHSTSEKWGVTTAAGVKVFAKYANQPSDLEALRNEHRIYSSVAQPCVPRLMGWEASTREAFLLIEDLSESSWPPPWDAATVEAIVNSLRDLESVSPPLGLPQLTDKQVSPDAWSRIRRSPESLVELGVCSAGWLASAVRPLERAAKASTVTGKNLAHGDVVRGNVCLRDGNALLVDWSHAATGNPSFDLAFWLPAQSSEGGPPPDRFLPDSEGLSARMAGFWAVRALADLEPGLKGLSRMYRRYLVSSLAWASRELGLDEPDGSPTATATESGQDDGQLLGGVPRAPEI